VILILLLALYGLGVITGVENLLYPAMWAEAATFQTALLSIFILALDSILPVPSSFVMTANGVIFGFWNGCLVSILGSLAASCSCYFVGRLQIVDKLLALKPEQKIFNAVDSWGMAAIVATRPLPLLAELFAIVAGTREMSFSAFLAASLAGSVPISIVYSLIGSGTNEQISLIKIILLYVFASGAAYGLAKILQSSIKYEPKDESRKC